MHWSCVRLRLELFSKDTRPSLITLAMLLYRGSSSSFSAGTGRGGWGGGGGGGGGVCVCVCVWGGGGGKNLTISKLCTYIQ